MKRFSEQFHKESQSVKLAKSEQADLRERLVSYMEYHPLPAELKQVVPKKKIAGRPILTEAFTTYRLPMMEFFKYGGAVAAIMLLVVPFVAERTVPGDTLYAVKVNFNEEVRGTLTFDSYQKVEWETTLLNRRIAEAKVLEREGLLTEEVGAEVAAAVKQHADNAKAQIETLRTLDADTAAIAAIEFDSTLAIQAQSLATADDTVADTDDADTQTEAAATLIAAAIDESASVETGQGVLPALDKLIARAEQSTTRVRELQQSLGEQFDGTSLIDVSRRIDDLERSLAEAFALDENSEEEARVMLVDVLTRAQKLVVYMTELEVRETVAIETAVPVVLTADEKLSIRLERLAELNVFINRLTATELEDEEVVAKVTAALEQLQTARTVLEQLAEEAHDQFITDSDTALALGADTVLFLEQIGVLIPVVPVPNDTASTTATSTPDVDLDTATSSATPTDPVDEPNTELPAEDSVDEATNASSTDISTPEPVDDQI